MISSDPQGISLPCEGILLDIEGTTSSIDFVFNEMFPYVRRVLPDFLARHGSDEDVVAACQQLALDAGMQSIAELCGDEAPDHCRQKICEHVLALMDQDSKTTGLKQLQGLIWKGGFEQGALRAHVYNDVPGALASWQQAGKQLRIYSSGSVAAQELFFGHTIYGNLLGYVQGHYDTRIGGKRETASYQRIVEDWQLPAESILFLSDVVAELDAAKTAGLQTGLLQRPGNAEPPADCEHPTWFSFDQIQLS